MKEIANLKPCPWNKPLAGFCQERQTQVQDELALFQVTQLV